jgi:Spy/CpxP family protein refolding chaperone
MIQKRFERAAVVAALLFLGVGPGLTCAQSGQPHAAQTPTVASPAARPKRVAPPTDYFAGLTFTDEQKAKIDEIHKNTKSRMEIVDKDEKLGAEQKGAMLDGYRRMENDQILKLLTPEQKDAVRQKIRALRQAGQVEKKKQQSPPK